MSAARVRATREGRCTHCHRGANGRDADLEPACEHHRVRLVRLVLVPTPPERPVRSPAIPEGEGYDGLREVWRRVRARRREG